MGLSENISEWKKCNSIINNLGKDKYYSLLKKNIDSINANILKSQSGYLLFFKDMKFYSHLVESNEQTEYFLNIFNRNSCIVFTINKDTLNNVIVPNEKKNLIIPYHSFFVETPLNFVIDEEKELYTVYGFVVQYFRDSNLLSVSYIWSRSIEDGFAPHTFNISIEGLLRNSFKELVIVRNNLNADIKTPFDLIDSKIHESILKLLYLIQTKEYSSYKKYENNQFKEHSIVYENDVKSHKRHFWTDTGRFKIPLMPKEELISKGYGVDGLVCRDGELRQDVPFRIIGEYRIEGKSREQNENRTINFSKNEYKREIELGKIISKIFPNRLLKHRDRRALKGLELDWLCWEYKLAFEYDGEQHYDKKLCEDVFKTNFESLKKRDHDKEKLCKKKCITLIRIKFNENLSLKNIKNKIFKVRPELLKWQQ